MNDFSKLTIRRLAKNGISIIGLQAIPDMSSDMPFANASRGYVVNDNGTCKVWLFADVVRAAK